MEKCRDSECGFGNNLEYCVNEAASPEGKAPEVMKMLDRLLFENDGVTNDSLHFQTDSKEAYFLRAFSYIQGDVKSAVWPLLGKRVVIDYTNNREIGLESYEVAIDWRVMQDEADTNFFAIRYTIDSYKKGDLQAVIEQPDVINNGRDIQLMTRYDYEKLWEELSIIDHLHNVERRDNALAV